MTTPHQEIDTLRQYKKNEFRFLAQKTKIKKYSGLKKLNLKTLKLLLKNKHLCKKSKSASRNLRQKAHSRWSQTNML